MTETTRQGSAVCFGDPDSFASEMLQLINEKEYSDVRFAVGEEKHVVYGHRCVLAARCEVFRAMLSVPPGSDPSASIVLPEIRPSIFLAVVEFIYTNCCSLSKHLVIDVMAAAIEYGLDGLTKLCVRYMRDSIECSTVCEFIQAALTYQQTTLQEECLLFIEINTEEVFKSPGFNEMSEDALSFILKSDKLTIDEGDILSKVKEWAHVNSVVTGSTLSEVAKTVIQQIRLPLLEPETLSEIELQNAKDHFIPVSLIAASWKFHALKRPDPADPHCRPRVGTLPRESLKIVGRGP